MSVGNGNTGSNYQITNIIMRKLKVISLTPEVYQVPIRKMRADKMHQFATKMATKVLEKLVVLGTLYAILRFSGVNLKMGF